MEVRNDTFHRYQCFAVVTGAASGMGRLYAEQLASSGYNLLLVDIDRQRLEDVADSITRMVASFEDWRIPYKSAFRVLPLVQDLSLPEAAARIHDFAVDNGCDVEVLVNNAGIFYYKDLVSTSRKALSSMIMVHDYTPLMLCREFVPDMIARGNGYVLNVSSLAAWTPWPGLGMYSSTKRFVKDFSKALRVECRNTGVSVTNAYFGAVDTPLLGLGPKYRRIAIGLRIMIPAGKAVDKALDAMFRRKKGTMPGLVNRLAKPLVSILPESVLSLIYKLLAPVRTKV